MNKSEMLQMVADKISACQKCPDLCSGRINTVPGEGNPDAKIMFIGEAPGKNESETGRPFVGQAGKLLRNIIKSGGWQPEDVFITNICKCRPPNNRTPTTEEADNCRAFLDLQIKIVKPKYIVCMGNVAAQNLLKTKRTISSLRGEELEYNGIKVIATWHPSYLLRNPSAKTDVWCDLQPLMESQNEVSQER